MLQIPCMSRLADDAHTLMCTRKTWVQSVKRQRCPCSLAPSACRPPSVGFHPKRESPLCVQHGRGARTSHRSEPKSPASCNRLFRLRVPLLFVCVFPRVVHFFVCAFYTALVVCFLLALLGRSACRRPSPPRVCAVRALQRYPRTSSSSGPNLVPCARTRTHPNTCAPEVCTRTSSARPPAHAPARPHRWANHFLREMKHSKRIVDFGPSPHRPAMPVSLLRSTCSAFGRAKCCAKRTLRLRSSSPS